MASFYKNSTYTTTEFEDVLLEEAFDMGVLFERNKHGWHNLIEHPDDVPSDERKVIVKCTRYSEKESYVDGCYVNGSWCIDGCNVTAWKDIDF